MAAPRPVLSVVGVYWHNKIVFGSVVAVPLVLVVLALMMLARSRPETVAEEHAPAQPLRPITLAGLSALTACLVVASALPGAGRWLPFEPATTTGECLVGTWREVSGSRTLPLSENISIPMTTTGSVWTINIDGTTRQDFGTGAVHKGEYKSIPVVITLVGTADYRYDIEDGKIHLHATTVSGRHNLRIGNAPGRDRPLAEVIDPDSTLKTTCEVDQLTVFDGNWTQKFARVTN
jgi:hypothetical protein